MAFPYPNLFYFIGFGADRILYGFEYEYGLFRRRKWYGFRPVSEQKQTFFKSDNMLHVVFYDEKQFINQNHKAVYNSR